MPSKKQRRRRAKSLRHEYDYVLVDEEGQEVEVDPAELRAQKEKSKPKAADNVGTSSGAKRTSRAGRVIQPPSWQRVGKRALIFAPFMFVAISLIDKNVSPAGHALQVVFLLAFFLPFSYVMDTIAYRTYLRRTGQAPAKDKDAKS